MAETATEARPLTAQERKVMDELLRRSGMTARPVQQVGQQYQALVNLSVPRPGDVNKQCDLVERGNTLTLTDEQAACYLPPNKPVALIRPASEVGQPFPRITHRMLSGQQRIPAYGRPDPAGATTVQIVETVPEATAPTAVGSENEEGPSAEDMKAAMVDAMDTAVRRET